MPTLDARRLFDYVLTASGEVSAEALRARIVHEIERRLPPGAVTEATALLDRYLAYRERVRAMAGAEGSDAADLEARLATLVALRREMLGAEAAEAFFAEEEADARRLLEVRRVMRDPALSAEARAERVAAIDAAAEAELPPEEREARAAMRLATTLRAAEDEVRSRGGDAAELQQLRERLAGPEAAGRLADLDRQRAAWQSRVDAYRAARERLANDPSLDEAARAAATRASSTSPSPSPSAGGSPPSTASRPALPIGEARSASRPRALPSSATRPRPGPGRSDPSRSANSDGAGGAASPSW